MTELLFPNRDASQQLSSRENHTGDIAPYNGAETPVSSDLDTQTILFTNLTATLAKAEGQINEALNEIQKTVTEQDRIALSLLARLYYLPSLPPDLLNFLTTRNASIPDFVQILGFPTPFGLLDVALSPKMEVARAISAWTTFLTIQALTAIEMHEVLFSGPDIVLASEEALTLSQNLPPAKDERTAPLWHQALEHLIPRILSVSLLLNVAPKSPSPNTPSWQQVLQTLLIRHVATPNAGLINAKQLEWALTVFETYSLTWNAVAAFLASTGIPRVFFRCMWELVVTVLPCKGDIYNAPHHQPAIYEPLTNAFILSPQSLTVHRLFAIGKNMVRAGTALPSPPEAVLNGFPPVVHPLLRAFQMREAPSLDPPAWIRRTERLNESLKNTLQHAKYLLQEGRSNAELFLSRLAFQGLCPIMVLNEDLGGFATKLESRLSIKFEVGSGVLTNRSTGESSEEEKGGKGVASSRGNSSTGLREAEIHRLKWMAITTGPSIVLGQASRRGLSYIVTTASPSLVAWVENQRLSENVEKILTLCRRAEPLSTDSLDLYDLVMRILGHSVATDTSSSPSSGQLDQTLRRIYQNPTSESLYKLIGYSPPSSVPEHFLSALLAHYLVSPFPLSLLGHPLLLHSQATEMKPLFPTLLLYFSFLKFSNPLRPSADTNGSPLSDVPEGLFTSSPEGLNKVLMSRLTSHVFTRCFGDVEKEKGGTANKLFFSSAENLDSNGGIKAIPPASSLPPASGVNWLLPELSGQNVILDFHQKREILDAKLRNTVAWWGPIFSIGDTAMESFAMPVLIRYVFEIESGMLDGVMRCISKFVKRPRIEGSTSNSLSHYLDCLVYNNQPSEICQDCQNLYFGQNPLLESPWAKIETEGNFIRNEKIHSDVVTLPLILKPILPLRIPVILIPEHPEPLLIDIIPAISEFNGCKGSGTKICPLGRASFTTNLVASAFRVVAFDAMLNPKAQKLTPGLRVSLFVSLSDVPHHSQYYHQRKSIALRHPTSVAMFGTLMIWQEEQFNILQAIKEKSIKDPSLNPTLTPNLINEPVLENIAIRDAEEAAAAMRSTLDTLSKANAFIKDCEPLLVTRMSATLPPMLIPDFTPALFSCSESVRFALSRWNCSLHSHTIMLALERASQLTLLRANPRIDDANCHTENASSSSST